MRLKTLLLSIAVLGVLSIIVAVVRRPSSPPSADVRINQPLVETAVIEQAGRLRLTDAGKTVELVKQPDGTWRVSSYYDFPADFAKLSGLVKNLTEARLQRLVTSNAERIARLEFKDTKIDLLDERGKELWSVTLGKTAEAGGRFVRFGSEQKAYLASLNAWLDTEPKNWANSTLVNVKPEEIARVEIPFLESGPVTLTRSKQEDPWSSDQVPTGQSVNADKVASLLNSLTNLRFTETLELTDPKVAEANAHVRAITLTTFEGNTLSFTFARKPEEKKLKPPASADGEQSGAAALGSLANAASAETKTPVSDPKLVSPEYETIPAGPVFVKISSSESNSSVNALMQKRAFQVGEYVFTSLPQSPTELFKAAETKE